MGRAIFNCLSGPSTIFRWSWGETLGTSSLGHPLYEILSIIYMLVPYPVRTLHVRNIIASATNSYPSSYICNSSIPTFLGSLSVSFTKIMWHDTEHLEKNWSTFPLFAPDPTWIFQGLCSLMISQWLSAWAMVQVLDREWIYMCCTEYIVSMTAVFTQSL